MTRSTSPQGKTHWRYDFYTYKIGNTEVGLASNPKGARAADADAVEVS